MPLFALANAGVHLGGMSLTGENLLVFFGIAAGLLLGKPLGISGLSWIFISFLAFPGGALLETAKLAILVASGTAGAMSLVAGRVLLPAVCSPESAATAAEAEGLR